MHTIAKSLFALCLAAPLAAQNCFWGDFGISLGHGTTDTVYAMQSIGFAFPLNGTTYTHIHVNDHGFVQLSNAGVPAPLTTGSAALYTPTIANFMAGGPKIAPLYSDMTLAGGGECFFRSTPTRCTVTWVSAQSYGIPSPRFSFQLSLHPDGVVTCVYDPSCTNNSTFGGSSASAIVGITPAGSAGAPASRDLSAGGVTATATVHEEFVAAGAFDCANNALEFVPSAGGYAFALGGGPSNCAQTTRIGVGCDGLALGSVGLPAIGNTLFRLRAELVPAVSPVAFYAIGTLWQSPGIPLGPSLGMTGCSAYTNADIGIFTGSQITSQPAPIAPTSFFNMPIPATSALVGSTFGTQALALSTANPFGLAASNGLVLRLGWSGPRLPPNPALNMVAIAPGTFQMGQSTFSGSVPVHQVTLTNGFWIGKYEVTQSQYQSVMGSNPSSFAAAPSAAQRPVENVSWSDAVAYCAALTASERAAGRVPPGYEYRLPTEAEWEYCCRAGTTTTWNTGFGITTAQANYGNALAGPGYPMGQTAVVGSYAANAWGLHDVHGNVWEWCLDSWSAYTAAAVTNPFTTGITNRICRGGSWNDASSYTTSGVRIGISPPVALSGSFGFRVALAPILVP